MKSKEYKNICKQEGVIIESFKDVEEALNSPYTFKYNILEYIEIYFNRYIRNPIEEIIRYIKRFIQRGKRGFGNSDVWGFDYYLGMIISQGIAKLLKDGNCAWTKKDLKALKTIQKTFETVVRIHNDRDRYIPSKEFTWKEYKRSVRVYKQLAKKYDGKYHVMTLREVKRFERGFDLFKEYYFHLWD